jgi:hypothetical protein
MGLTFLLILHLACWCVFLAALAFGLLVCLENKGSNHCVGVEVVQEKPIATALFY